MSRHYATVLNLCVALAGCAALGTLPAPEPAPRGETVRVSVGPCFGFCPVYTLGLTPNGEVLFRGERHTAVLGARTRRVSAADARAAAAALRPFRPADGTTAALPCKQLVSDQSRRTITWTDAQGRATTLEHDRGCRSAEAQALDAVLDALPARLGADGWARQVTRPGTSRG
jgi:hypothetical protein